MAKHISPMRLNENLVAEAQVIAATMHRSTAEQIEYWSEIGKRISNELTTQQLTQLMTGVGHVVFTVPTPAPLDVMALSDEVEADSKAGRLHTDLLAQGQILYEPAPEGVGLLTAFHPDGTTSKGRFKNGAFKTVRKNSA